MTYFKDSYEEAEMFLIETCPTGRKGLAERSKYARGV